MTWNYLQVETTGTVLHPVVGPGGMTRLEAHHRIRALLTLHAETTPSAASLIDAWDAGAEDDTVFAGPYLWAIYESEDPAAGAREWVEDLAAGLRRSGSRVRISW
jgi:hypothetical protein